MYGNESGFWGFLDKYVIAGWLNDTTSEPGQDIYGVVSWFWCVLFLLLGIRLTYIIFYKKESCRYVNTEMIYLILFVVSLIFASIFKLMVFLLLCGLLLAAILAVLKSGYLEIAADEERGIFAYLPWVRREQAKSIGEGVDLDAEARRSLHIVEPGDFHYKPHLPFLVVISWAPALVVFVVLNYLLPLMR